MSSAEVDREPCADCDGSGVRATPVASLDSSEYQPCPTCRGYGHVVDEDGDRGQAVRQGALLLLVLVAIAAIVVIVAMA